MPPASCMLACGSNTWASHWHFRMLPLRSERPGIFMFAHACVICAFLSFNIFSRRCLSRPRRTPARVSVPSATRIIQDVSPGPGANLGPLPVPNDENECLSMLVHVHITALRTRFVCAHVHPDILAASASVSDSSAACFHGQVWIVCKSSRSCASMHISTDCGGRPCNAWNGGLVRAAPKHHSNAFRPPCHTNFFGAPRSPLLPMLGHSRLALESGRLRQARRPRLRHGRQPRCRRPP